MSGQQSSSNDDGCDKEIIKYHFLHNKRPIKNSVKKFYVHDYLLSKGDDTQPCALLVSIHQRKIFLLDNANILKWTGFKQNHLTPETFHRFINYFVTLLSIDKTEWKMPLTTFHFYYYQMQRENGNHLLANPHRS